MCRLQGGSGQDLTAHVDMDLLVDTDLLVTLMWHRWPADSGGTTGPAQGPPATQGCHGKTKTQRGGKKGRAPEWHGVSQHHFYQQCWTQSPAALSHVTALWASLCSPRTMEERRGSSWREKKRRGIQMSLPEFSSPDQNGGREGEWWVGTFIAGKNPAAPRATAVMGCQGEKQVFL